MKTNTKLRSYLTTTIALALPSLAPAANLLFDNFDSYTAGSLVPNTGIWSTVTSHATVSDAGTPFGAPNQYVDYDDNSTSNSAIFHSQSITDASNVLTTLSLDFYEPDVAGRNDRIKIGYSIDGQQLLGLNTRVNITLDDGVLGGTTGGTGTSYSFATAYRLYMVLNDSASAVSYTGGGSIASGEAHVWFEDLSTNALTFAGIAAGQNLATLETGYGVAFRANGGGDRQQIFLDDVSLDTGLLVPGLAVIPEPTAALLGSLGVLLLLRRPRRS